MSNPALETGIDLAPQFNDQGLIPAIVQDDATGQILMMGWMNQAALTQTLETRLATFYSRSRQKMWVKGESSGHTQQVLDARIDCDQDVVLLRCKSNGPCCHVGYTSCFYRRITPSQTLEVIDEKAYDPDAVYGP